MSARKCKCCRGGLLSAKWIAEDVLRAPCPEGLESVDRDRLVGAALGYCSACRLAADTFCEALRYAIDAAAPAGDLPFRLIHAEAL
jgi:hypothetical protein